MLAVKFFIVLIALSLLLVGQHGEGLLQLASVSWATQAGLKPGEVIRDRLKNGGYGPEMVIVPAGRFRMGDIQGIGGKNEQPVHEVHIARRFATNKYEITFDEYDEFAKATGRKLPDDEGWGRGRQPVIGVWNS